MPQVFEQSLFLFLPVQGTGSPFHNAGNYNMFYMIDGTKRWYFIDPHDQYMCNPIHGFGGVANMCLAAYPDEYDPTVMPAFKHCPYYVADLRPVSWIQFHTFLPAAKPSGLGKV